MPLSASDWRRMPLMGTPWTPSSSAQLTPDFAPETEREKEILETLLQKKRASRARMERMDEHAWLLTQKTSTSGSIQGAGMGAGMRAAADAPIS